MAQKRRAKAPKQRKSKGVGDTDTLPLLNSARNNTSKDTRNRSTKSMAVKQGSKEYFLKLLENPIVKKALPADFDKQKEAEHLSKLYRQIGRMRQYIFDRFVFAGASGMVFKVIPDWDGRSVLAMKIVRRKLYEGATKSKVVAQTLSPISETELRALSSVRHPNVVYLHDTISEGDKIIAILTSYIEPPTPIDDFMVEGLVGLPGRQTGLKSFSPERLDRACEFLVGRFTEVASALVHMHGLKGGAGIYHFDIKPANILIPKSGPGEYHAVLTDMGACIHGDRVKNKENIRVHFSWPYAHPDLRDLVHDPGSITGGLKASVNVDPRTGLMQYDLYAFGRTIQQLLAILRDEFGERCYASYGFRYLHIIACMLLDGHNILGSEPVLRRDGVSFVNDLALGYPRELWSKHKITSADELLMRLRRFTREFSWNHITPELDAWQPRKLNCVVQSPAPFTDRVAKVMNHPCSRRLKSELQLGWVREVFPGASHNRWAHCIGAFSALVGYYNALLSDPEVPTFRIFVDHDDLSHAFVAALVHDLAQTTFGHDFEEACPELFRHEEFNRQLLQDERWGTETLGETIRKSWDRVNVDRVLDILNMSRGAYDHPLENGAASPRRAIDGVAADAIDGPIDADKADYLLRDSVACGVPYGHGIDMRRFLQALTVASVKDGKRLSLAYKAKGRPAIASLLLARYQMYGAVYWHHTFRCIQAMFVHAAASTFGTAGDDGVVRGRLHLSQEEIRSLFYERVICRATWEKCSATLKGAGSDIGSESIWEESPPPVWIEPSLDFVWQFSNPGIRGLVERLAKRELYKRVFELPLGQLEQREYAATQNELKGPNRLSKAKKLEELLLEGVSGQMMTQDSSITGMTSTAREVMSDLIKEEGPLIILDFPSRGLPNEYNIPRELEDPVRKYFTLSIRRGRRGDDLFATVRNLQVEIATVRVFAEPRFHEIIIRYLQPSDIHRFVIAALPSLRQAE